MDEGLRRATELQIAHFGQIPMQLFRHPHPPKRTPSSPLFTYPGNSVSGVNSAAAAAQMALAPYALPRPLRKSLAPPRRATWNSGRHHGRPGDGAGDADSLSVVSPAGPAAAGGAGAMAISGRAPSFLAPPESDEEAVAVDAPCTIVQRQFSQPIALAPSVPLAAEDSGDGPRLRFEPTGHTFVPPGVIVSIAVLPERLILVLGSGVVEAYRYYTSEAAKSALALAAAVAPGSRNDYKGSDARHAEKGRVVPPAATAPAPAPAQPLAAVVPAAAPRPPAAPASLDLDTLISFDDDVAETASTSSFGSLPPPHAAAAAAAHGKKGGAALRAGAHPAPQRILSRKEPLVAVERDVTHFDVLPRLPLTKVFLRRDPAFSPAAITGAAIDHSHYDPAVAGRAAPAAPGASSAAGAAAASKTKPQAVLWALDQAAGLVAFTHSYRLALSAGRVDGSVAVREVDPRNGFILSAGDFSAHRHRVVGLAVDSIAYSRTDVVASCDAHGTCLVWTVSRVQNGPAAGAGAAAAHSYVISRRPQRLFHFAPSQHARCEISWQMGVVVTVSKGTVSVFSVERDERLKAFDFSCAEDEDNADQVAAHPPQAPGTAHHATPAQSAADLLDLDVDGSNAPSAAPSPSRPARYNFGRKSTGSSGLSSTRLRRKGSGADREEDPDVAAGLARRVALCDDGVVVLHVERVAWGSDGSDDSGEAPDLLSFAEGGRYGGLNAGTSTSSGSSGSSGSGGGREAARSEHYLLSYALQGVRTGRVRVASPVTFLGSPDRGMDVVAAGHEDGRVTLYRASDLVALYSFVPHLDCVAQAAPGHAQPPRTDADGGGKSGSGGGGAHTAVLCVRLGPSPEAPALICVSDASGALYLRPLPDFVRWERTRVPSALSALVSAPMAAVRGTIMQAQTIAAEAAGVLAENAKSFMAEKLTKSKVLNNLFGAWGKKA